MKLKITPSIIKTIAISLLFVIAGCATIQPSNYSGVNGPTTGYNNISREQAFAECKYESQKALNAELNRTGGVFSAGYAGAEAREGCMSSKGFHRVAN